MRKLVWAMMILTIAFGACNRKDVWTRIETLSQQGKFQQARELIDDYLAKAGSQLTTQERSSFEFERERLLRVPKDFDLTRSELLERLKKSVRNFKERELEQWEAEGRFESILFEGERKYQYASLSNLFFRYPDIRARRLDAPDRADFERAMWNYYLKVKEEGEISTDRFICPQRFRGTMTVSVKPNVVPEGETVRCWLPYPRAFPFQTDIQLIDSSPDVLWIDEPQSDIRSVYLEKMAMAGKPTEFKISFEYTSWARYVKATPEKVMAYNKDDPVFLKYTSEREPHVVFTPELRALAVEIVADEPNPYLKARRIYDWISKNIVYSYMVEYSTIPNISMFCFEHKYGDCGVEALLFITLCRISGVPARWQSCWNFPRGKNTIHDWCEFYVEPYGWLPCDPYCGIWSTQMITSLNEEQKQALNDFYFGNMSAYRMVANADHNAKLYPPKRSFRSDDVDFQRGELEWGDTNIYFDQRSYTWNVEEID